MVILISLTIFLIIKKENNNSNVPKIYLKVKDKINDNYAYGKINIDNIQYDVKVKLRGHSTKLKKKQSYTIKFNKDTKLFNLSKDNKYTLISNIFDKSLIRNKMVYDFSNKSKIKYTVKSLYVDLYLNNKYMGNYLLCDKIDIKENKVNIKKNSDYLLEYDTINNENSKKYITTKNYKWRFQVKNNINKYQEKDLINKLNKIETIIKKNNYNDIKEYIDIDSFIDSYIIEEYFKDVDCNHSSLYFYLKDNKLYAGPIWDFDLSMGLTMNSNEDDFEYLNENGFGNKSNHSYEGIYCNKNIYKELLKNKKFKKMVKKRYLELQTEIEKLYTNKEQSYISYTTNRYYKEFKKNNCRWRKDVCEDKYYDIYIKHLKKWLKNRNNWLLNNL